MRLRLSTWLLRPYLDLGPCAQGPLHVHAVEEGWRAYSEGRTKAFAPQRAMPPGFRAQLAAEAGGAPYDVRDPRELPDGLRTARWRELCAALDAWHGAPAESQVRLARLLHSLCLYQPLLALIPGAPPRGAGADPQRAELAFLRASAQYMLGLPRRIAEYDNADLSVFVDIALQPDAAQPAGFNCTAMVFVHKAKTGAPPGELEEWSGRLERALAEAVARADDFTARLLTSRFYRATGFLPQRRGDRAEVVRVMNAAEQHALAIVPSSDAEQRLYLENLHALTESRTKEALWLGDLDGAAARARALTQIDPYDSKAWVELGQVHFLRKEWREGARAYALAAMLGPPASAVGRHMAGACLRELGEDALAALLFRDTLEIDPLGISPLEEIDDLPDESALRVLRRWARDSFPPQG